MQAFRFYIKNDCILNVYHNIILRMEERLKILNNILEISDSTDNTPIEINKIDLEFSSNKYSSKKNSIYHLSLNGKHLSKRDKLNIKYKCITCENIHIVGTTQFIRKVNKCSYRCNLCCNKDINKRLNHSYYFLSKDIQTNNDKKQLSLVELREESVRTFEEFDEDFKNNYWSCHLTDDDYKRISKNTISIHNGKYKIEDLEYWSVFKTNNQMLFSSIFYDKKNNIVLRANQPVLQCDNCNNTWRAKKLESFKNCHKIMCSSCTLCNKTYKIRTTKNCVNDIILYQSKLELKFIHWCNNNAIVVNNGPVLPYYFENKERKYRVDFKIKDLLIEIKDNHHWFQNDIKSGKHNAKIEAVNDAIKKGEYKEYYLITPDVWNNTLKKIKSK